ncbi:hypothetical protein L2E82_13864 [Cichorium intybus]|uniref:Uncharacterized protein n=1 Tax=Cichorium intybus TaxID=13427 RepID=A0ACB9EYT2_CICIN|nr:hypothetical protein L1887_33510 [Cichorium endivia]KAI3763866.1 hypothetical protein L2E82_13864 [Cichorium intybus]
MEKSAPEGKTVSVFVNWEEVSSTNQRGRREVRYYLKRRDGTSDLAVVGKEKKPGYETKMSSSSFRYRYAIRDKSLFPSSDIPFETSSKLRSRRQVIDWLSSLVTDGSFSHPPQYVDGFLGAKDTSRFKLQNKQEFLWVGSFWTCKKKRKHYESYTRSGVKISVHDFVYVLAEENKRLVAYLEDLYEDSRRTKMAVVRWFHKVDEVVLDLPHTYNDKEIFFSLCIQDLSIECIDGLATILSPQHYEKFLKIDDVCPKMDLFLCQNQFEDEVIKPFDITQLKGYWNQPVHKLISRNSDADVANVRPKKRLRRLVDREYEYTIGSEIEVLSQDSGIKGVWFKALIIKKHKDKIKVRYQDLKDAVDESLNLEEWVLTSRVAVLDEMGIRYSGRMTVRPSRFLKKVDFFADFDVGCVVDAWWNDGWWEGIVVEKENDEKDGNKIHVYFPWEKKRLIFGCKDLRFSQEWFGGEWKRIKNRKDLVALISSDTQTTKSHDNVSGLTDHKGQNGDFEVMGCYSKEDLIANLKWDWSTKKRMQRLSTLKTRNHGGFVMDHENFKFICDSSPFCPPLRSLVMSR